MFSTRAHAVPWIEQADIGLPWHATVRRQWIWECSTELVDGRRRGRVQRTWRSQRRFNTTTVVCHDVVS